MTSLLTTLSRCARVCAISVAVVACGLASATAQESPFAGMVKRVSGMATLERSGKSLPLTAGMRVLRGDRIVTGSPGGVGIVLADDTILTAGPGARLELSDVRFDTTTHDGNIVVRLFKGALHVVSGLLAKHSPDNVRFESPTAVMGVRGTEFIIDAPDEGNVQ